MNQRQQEKFKMYYDPLHKPLDRFCRMISGNKMDGEDLLHDTVLLTMKHFDRIENKQAMQSYMYTVASNLNKRRFKKQKRQVVWDEEEIAQMTDQNISPEQSTDFKIIHEKILDLPAKVSETLMLFYVADLKMEEIRKIQGDSLSAVKLRLKRGREKLINSLSEREQMTLVFLMM